MISTWKGHYILSRHLKSLINLYFLLLQVVRINHGVDVQQDIRILLE
jgi:hypothetical protein